MKTIYDVTYFIKKFQAIHEDMWMTGHRGWNGLDGKYCADGFCGTRDGIQSQESLALTDLLFPLLPQWRQEDGQKWEAIYLINDGCLDEYQQPTPKQRILAALYDIYEKTYGRKYQAEPEPKERIVYVMVDSTVKELSGQLTNN